MPAGKPWSAMVEAPGVGIPKSEEQPDAKQIAHAPQPTLRSTDDKKREGMPIARDGERSLPDARRAVIEAG